MMKIICLSLALFAVSVVSTTAFVPQLPAKNTFGRVAMSKTRVNMFGEGDGEQKKLTRDNEPEDFFAT
jgi:hypothetical protein